MPKKQVIEFVESHSLITELVTKFGGQPNWIAESQWPISEETGNPMRFICQIALNHESDFVTPAHMAYLFMTDEEDDEYVDGTWEPDGGENAIILQPGDHDLLFEEISDGPSLYRMVEQSGNKRLQQESCEFSVRLTTSEDVVYMSEADRWKLPEQEQKSARGILN